MISSWPEFLNKTASKICACGHPVSSHVKNSQKTRCNHRNLNCPCEDLWPFVAVLDWQPFHFKTTGPFELHALYKGIRKYAAKNTKIEYLSQKVCVICMSPTEKLLPVSMSSSSNFSRLAGPRNAFVCLPCLPIVLISLP